MRFFRACVVACLAVVATGCGRESSRVPASMPAVLHGRVHDVVAHATPGLRSLVAERTEIVRVDRADEIVLRCSVRASDRSVRLVEIHFRESENAATTTVTAVSRAFAFALKPTRDRLDAEVEANVLAAVRAAEASDAGTGAATK